MSENNEPILPVPAPDAEQTVAADTARDEAVQGRRTFLQSLGKWSGAAILAVVGTSWMGSAPKARAGGWINRGGGGGGWVNSRGGGGVWVNGGGGGWVNRGGGWINGGGGGGWVNRRGGGGSWVNRW